MEVGNQHNPHGLREQDVTVLRETRGYNEMEEKKRNKCLEFLKHFWGPMPIMMSLAILIEAIQFDWIGFCGARRLVRRDELSGRDQGIEEEFGTGVQSETQC